MGDWWSTEGAKDTLARSRYLHEGQFLEAARGDDFVGVQAYSRVRMDETGIIGPEDGVEVVTSMDYEFWPQSLEVAIRSAAEIAQVPIYVTENGLGHEDDARRIAYVTEALEGVGRCLADGIDVRGYFYWSLARQLRVEPGLRPQVRARLGHPGHLRAHAQAVGRLARRHRPGQPAELTGDPY